MSRRSRSSTAAEGLRELLIAQRERDLARWPLAPGGPDDWLEDLRAHVPVAVSSQQLLKVLGRAGLPHDRFAFGGADWRKEFVLDEFDQLSET